MIRLKGARLSHQRLGPTPADRYVILSNNKPHQPFPPVNRYIRAGRDVAPFMMRRLLKPAARPHQHKRLISCVYTNLCLYVRSFFFSSAARRWYKSCDAITWVTDPVCLAMNVFNHAGVARYQINMFPFFSQPN